MINFKTHYGPWALVTGASSGIGEEFAGQLASLGFNIVLVARSKNRLDAVSERIRQYGVETLVIVADLSDLDFLNEIVEKTKAIEIGLLVTNAGGYTYGSFHKTEIEQLSAFLRLNTNAHMQLAHYYGKKMKARGRGGIILVSSTGAFCAIPYMTSYVASKAFILSLGEGLHLEMKEHGVDVMVLAPGTTETPGTMNAKNIDNSKLGVSFMPARIVVACALKNLGRKAVVVPGAINKFSVFMGKYILPRMTMAKLLGKIMRKAISPEVI